MTIRSAAAAVDGFDARTIRVALAFAISLFFIRGVAYGLLDVLNKHFQDTLHVGTAESTLLQIAYFGAYLLVSVPAGMLLQRKGYRFGILTGLGVTAFSGDVTPVSSSIWN